MAAIQCSSQRKSKVKGLKQRGYGAQQAAAIPSQQADATVSNAALQHSLSQNCTCTGMATCHGK
jgi:hypothetical protein